MSALRLSVPGYPTRLIDEGPATPHRIHGVYVPVSVVGSMRPVIHAAYPEHHAPYPLKPPLSFSIQPGGHLRPICGVTMRIIGEPCARMHGHRDGHRSEARMQADAVRRRTSERGHRGGDPLGFGHR